jgi:hypothetical protein
MAILISRFIEGISLNGKEYLLDDKNEPILFNSKIDAVNHLNKNFECIKTEEEWEEQGIYIDDDE